MTTGPSPRVTAFTRWFYALAIPGLGRTWREETVAGAARLARTDWPYLTAACGMSLSTVASSLPDGDPVRSVDDDTQIGPSLGYDLTAPTVADPTIDSDFAPITGGVQPGTAAILAAAFTSGEDTVRAIHYAAGEHPDEDSARTSSPDAAGFLHRLAALATAEDALRVLLFRRNLYLLDRDEHVRAVPVVWGRIAEAALAGEPFPLSREAIDTVREDLRIDPQWL